MLHSYQESLLRASILLSTISIEAPLSRSLFSTLVQPLTGPMLADRRFLGAELISLSALVNRMER